MTSHYLITMIACICVTGLAATTVVAEEDTRNAQVALQIIQINPLNAAGARIIAAWNAEVEKMRKPTENGTEQPAGATAPGRTIDEEDGTFEVLTCDADKLFEQVFTGEKEAAAGTIAAPRLIACVDQESAIHIGRKVPYMVKRGDGSLVVEQSDDLLEGVFAKVMVGEVSQPKSGDVLTCQVDLHLKISSVTGRRPITGVPFDVGRPIISSRETVSILRVASGTDVVIRMPQPNRDDEPIFAVLTVEIVETEEP